MAELHWNTDTVRRVMASRGIRNREDLAKCLVPEVSRMTVYRGFTEEWKGRVTSIPLFVAIADTFAVPIAELVMEPLDTRQNLHPPTIDRGIETSDVRSVQ